MHRRWFWCAIASSLAVLALMPATAGAAIAEQQLQEAVGRTVSWFRGQQESDGALGVSGGLDPAWALLGLAGAGVNAADLSTGVGGSSAQDYYLGLWTGPNDKAWTSTGTPQASDYERVIMLANAAGLDPLPLSSEQNLLAKLAGFDDKGYFGPKSTFNQTMFALIALDQVPVPDWLVQQIAGIIEANAHEDGGYTYSTVESKQAYERAGEIDLTGAAIAGLCGAGRTAQSPAVAKAIKFLAEQRSVTNGQIGNIDSTSWALDGMGACGVKRGSPEWNAEDERTIEWLLSQQLPEGAWPVNGIANSYATQDALRALDAPSFDVELPPRLDPNEPARRQPPSVAAGTPVPVVLAIDAGFGSIQLCSTTAPAGATLPEVLAAARAQSNPAGCVTELGADVNGITSLDGAVPRAGSGAWKLSLDDGAEQTAAAQSIGFGEVVGLRLEDPAPLGVSPLSLNFSLQVSGAQTTQEVTVTNRDSNPVRVEVPRITGVADNDYRVASQDCVGQTLATGSSCTVSIRFTTSAGGVADATLEIPIEAQGAVAIGLQGELVAPPPQKQPAEPIVENKGGGQGPLSPQGPTGGQDRTTSPTTTPSSPPDTGTGHAASGLSSPRITGLSPTRLSLELTGAGTVTVRIARWLGKGHHGRWQAVKRIVVRAVKAGQSTVKLGQLPPGRYRVTVAVPDGKDVTRTLTISARTARRA